MTTEHFETAVATAKATVGIRRLRPRHDRPCMGCGKPRTASSLMQRLSILLQLIASCLLVAATPLRAATIRIDEIGPATIKVSQTFSSSSRGSTANPRAYVVDIDEKAPIIAEIGKSLAIRFLIASPSTRLSEYRVTVVWTPPKAESADAEEVKSRRPRVTVVSHDSGLPAIVTFTFRSESDLIPGLWNVQLQIGGRTLASQDFEVRTR